MKNKIHIIGPSGSGKTHLAKNLSSKLHIFHYDLDDIFWERKYDIKRDELERKRILENICQEDSWIMEGVYTNWVSDAIKESELLIWVDAPLPVLTYRLMKRFHKRRKEGADEKFIDTMNLVKAVRKYKKQDGYKEYEQVVEEYDNKIIRIQNKREMNSFLDDIVVQLPIYLE